MRHADPLREQRRELGAVEVWFRAPRQLLHHLLVEHRRYLLPHRRVAGGSCDLDDDASGAGIRREPDACQLLRSHVRQHDWQQLDGAGLRLREVNTRRTGHSPQTCAVVDQSCGARTVRHEALPVVR